MNEKTVSSRRVYDGRLIKVDELEVQLDNGRLAHREIIRHPGAVVVLACATDGRLVLVRQYRKAAEQELLEAVAGTRDPGETAELCATREVKEETGYAVKQLRALGHIYSAPGFCQERLDLFFAELDGAPGSQEPDQDEALDVVHLDIPAFEAMIARGEIHDAKTLAIWAQAKAANAIP